MYNKNLWHWSIIIRINYNTLLAIAIGEFFFFFLGMKELFLFNGNLFVIGLSQWFSAHL